MAITADDNHAWPTTAKFGTDDMDNAISFVTHRQIIYRSRPDVRFERFKLQPRFVIGHARNAIFLPNRWNIMVCYGQRQIGSTDDTARYL